MSPHAGRAQPPGDPVLHVVSGVNADGTATEQWRVMLRRRLADAPYDSVARITRRPSLPEAAWEELIRTRAAGWPRLLPAITAPFAPVRRPAFVTIVLGNRGAHDAFTHDSTTIGFDLSALVAEYGAPNADLIDRLFRHEYVHLLQKAWWSQHPYDTRSPLRWALAEMWSEGLGNYYSMSDRWRAAAGAPSRPAAEALEVLEPRLLARLAALACAPIDRADTLTSDLSWGRFDRKWGALTPALWLEMEVSAFPEALRTFVSAGPDGIWALAERRMAPGYRAVLKEIRETAERCAGS